MPVQHRLRGNGPDDRSIWRRPDLVPQDERGCCIYLLALLYSLFLSIAWTRIFKRKMRSPVALPFVYTFFLFYFTSFVVTENSFCNNKKKNQFLFAIVINNFLLLITICKNFFLHNVITLQRYKS